MFIALSLKSTEQQKLYISTKIRIEAVLNEVTKLASFKYHTCIYTCIHTYSCYVTFKKLFFTVVYIIAITISYVTYIRTHYNSKSTAFEKQ